MDSIISRALLHFKVVLSLAYSQLILRRRFCFIIFMFFMSFHEYDSIMLSGFVTAVSESSCIWTRLSVLEITLFITDGNLILWKDAPFKGGSPPPSKSSKSHTTSNWSMSAYRSIDYSMIRKLILVMVLIWYLMAAYLAAKQRTYAWDCAAQITVDKLFDICAFISFKTKIIVIFIQVYIVIDPHEVPLFILYTCRSCYVHQKEVFA